LSFITIKWKVTGGVFGSQKIGVLRELARVIRRELVDVNPSAVGMLMLEKAQAPADRIAWLEEVVGDSRSRDHRREQNGSGKSQQSHQNSVRCLIAADSVPSSR
jgi:hypothetical protein